MYLVLFIAESHAWESVKCKHVAPYVILQVEIGATYLLGCLYTPLNADTPEECRAQLIDSFDRTGIYGLEQRVDIPVVIGSYTPSITTFL